MSGRVIEVRIDIELTSPDEAVVPTPFTDPSGPTVIEITPIQTLLATGRALEFRVTFEPDNPDRRAQPYRSGLEAVFPDGWSYGDPLPENVGDLN